MTEPQRLAPREGDRPVTPANWRAAFIDACNRRDPVRLRAVLAAVTAEDVVRAVPLDLEYARRVLDMPPRAE